MVKGIVRKSIQVCTKHGGAREEKILEFFFGFTKEAYSEVIGNREKIYIIDLCVRMGYGFAIAQIFMLQPREVTKAMWVCRLYRFSTGIF